VNKPFYFATGYRSAFLASMAERLKEEICLQAEEIFSANRVTTPVNDVSFMVFLAQQGASSIAAIARAQNYSHQRVTQRINSLEKLGLVERVADPHDMRCKLISLTTRGEEEMPFLEQMYGQTAIATDDLFDEIQVDLVAKIGELLDALRKKPLVDRLQELPANTPIE